MKTIDTKSVLIGLLFGVCALLALGAASGNQVDVGRYQIACPDNQATCFVVDTKTGQLWQKYSKTSGHNYGYPAQWDK
jgi:hypothetical protein